MFREEVNDPDSHRGNPENCFLCGVKVKFTHTLRVRQLDVLLSDTGKDPVQLEGLDDPFSQPVL